MGRPGITARNMARCASLHSFHADGMGRGDVAADANLQFGLVSVLFVLEDIFHSHDIDGGDNFLHSSNEAGRRAQESVAVAIMRSFSGRHERSRSVRPLSVSISDAVVESSPDDGGRFGSPLFMEGAGVGKCGALLPPHLIYSGLACHLQFFSGGVSSTRGVLFGYFPNETQFAG